MTHKHKEELVKSGKSKVFNNWHTATGVSMDDFIEGLKWLEEDQRDEYGRVTRELGCRDDGCLIKIKRVHDVKLGTVFYEIGSKKLWNKAYPSISKDDPV